MMTNQKIKEKKLFSLGSGLFGLMIIGLVLTTLIATVVLLSSRNLNQSTHASSANIRLSLLPPIGVLKASTLVQLNLQNPDSAKPITFSRIKIKFDQSKLQLVGDAQKKSIDQLSQYYDKIISLSTVEETNQSGEILLVAAHHPTQISNWSNRLGSLTFSPTTIVSDSETITEGERVTISFDESDTQLVNRNKEISTFTTANSVLTYGKPQITEQELGLKVTTQNLSQRTTFSVSWNKNTNAKLSHYQIAIKKNGSRDRLNSNFFVDKKCLQAECQYQFTTNSEPGDYRVTLNAIFSDNTILRQRKIVITN